jgi:chromosome segregation ATPase
MTQSTDTNTDILKRLDAIAADIQVIKISQARTEEKFNSIDQRIDALDKSLNQRIDALDKSLSKRIDSLEQRSVGQETRFWGLVVLLGGALLTILGKVVFFPVDKL